MSYIFIYLKFFKIFLFEKQREKKREILYPFVSQNACNSQARSPSGPPGNCEVHGKVASGMGLITVHKNLLCPETGAKQVASIALSLFS